MTNIDDVIAAARNLLYELTAQDFLRAAARLRATLAARDLERRYNPNWPSQPRVPHGHHDGGQWTDDGRGLGGENDSDVRVDGAVGRVAARISPAREAQCQLQYDQDIFHCRMVGLASCYAQAAERYAACLAGRQIPRLNY